MLELPHARPSSAQLRQARMYRESRLRAAVAQVRRDGMLALDDPEWVQGLAREVTEAVAWEQQWLADQLGEAVESWAMLWMAEQRGVDALARRRGGERAGTERGTIRAALLHTGSQLRRFTFATPELAVTAVAYATEHAAGLLARGALEDPLLAEGVWTGLARLLDPQELEVVRALAAGHPSLTITQLVGNARAILR